MKISTFITMLLIVGILLFAIVETVKESENLYGIDVNKTSWEGQYEFAESVNESVSPIQESLDDIGNEEKGWFEKIGSGFTGIIAAVKFIPTMMWETSKMGINLITGISKTFGIPSFILFTITIMLLVWGIIELIQFFQRWNM